MIINVFIFHLEDARNGKVTSIYSVPFYSSPKGYKVCIRLYPNGDGNARHTHMSVFIVLMRSEQDAILKFPFDCKITFCLCDQTNQKKSVIDSFRSDINSNSFQRPRSEMNIASGIPKFVTLLVLSDPNNPYLKNDTIFIKAHLDFEKLPRSVISYAMNLNPGLPINVQNRLIKKEELRIREVMSKAKQ